MAKKKRKKARKTARRSHGGTTTKRKVRRRVRRVASNPSPRRRSSGRRVASRRVRRKRRNDSPWKVIGLAILGGVAGLGGAALAAKHEVIPLTVQQDQKKHGGLLLLGGGLIGGLLYKFHPALALGAGVGVGATGGYYLADAFLHPQEAPAAAPMLPQAGGAVVPDASMSEEEDEEEVGAVQWGQPGRIAYDDADVGAVAYNDWRGI